MNKQYFKKEDFETDNLTLYPLIMHGFPNIRGKHKWIFKGFADLTQEDKIIPDFLNIGMHKIFCTSTIKKETQGKYGCAIIRNFANKRIHSKDFDTIKHIGQFIHSTPRAVRTIVTMHWMHKNQDSIDGFYSKEDSENDFWLGYSKNQILRYDVDFTKVRHKGRLKAKIKD